MKILTPKQQYQYLRAKFVNASWRDIRPAPQPPPTPAVKPLAWLRERLHWLRSSAAAIVGLHDVSAETRARLLADNERERADTEARIAKLAPQKVEP
jgi:hypothetical protein